MKSFSKIVFIVLDGVGIGELPDASAYGDSGTNTLGNTARAVGGLHLPTLQRLGLGNISALQGVEAVPHPAGCFGKMREISKGKDSTTGHWEISGIIVEKDFPVYPHGFPAGVIEKFLSATHLNGVLGNTPASGTQIIQELGNEHVRTGFPIVYTSGDSVFQIAAHEEIIAPEELYRICRVARTEVLIGAHAVGRVIARPFVGKDGKYTRTANRKDFALEPPGTTVLDILFEHDVPTTAIGKIDDLFSGRGLREAFHTKSNDEGIEQIVRHSRLMPHGLLMANLVDFDMLYGHRQDPKGMASALEHFDSRLPSILEAAGERDLVMITGDHGNDPTDRSTDHSREYVPMLCFSRSGKKGVNIGERKTFADAGKTIAEYFGLLAPELAGTSYLGLIS